MRKNNTVAAQFDARSSKFSRSASWVTDKRLLAAHKKAVFGLLPAKGRLLEVCCGTGVVTGAIKRRGLETYGVDISTGMLKQAAKRIRHLRRADAHKLPFSSGFFDAVVMRQAMQFLRPAAFLKEAKRVLKPGGVLLLSHHVPRGEAERSRLLVIYRLIQPSGVFRNASKLYLAQELRGYLAGAGFRVKKVTRLFTTEPISALLACYPNLPAAGKERIFQEYLKAPAGAGKACGIVRKEGALCARWKWVVFTALKPER